MTKVKYCLLAYILFLTVIQPQAKVGLQRLTVEGRSNPVGIDVLSPRFGWQITSDKKSVVQKSYHIMVASSADRLDTGNIDVWDSGIVYSDSSQWVGMKSTSLAPNTVYFWKVKIITNWGETGWSEISKWSTGLLRQENWKGEWIGLDSLMPWDKEVEHSRLSARYLRKVFRAKKKIHRATAHISGLGIYQLYINGEKVGNDELTPSATDFTQSVIYNTYDVTSLLKSDNAIGVILAPGRYFAVTQNFQTNVRTTYGYPKLMLNLILEYADGSMETITSDRSWRLNADGAVRYANYYDGEMYDVRKEFTGWTNIGFDDSQWMTARTVSAPGGKMKGNLLPAMHVYETDKPADIKNSGNRHLIDFGTNGAGRVRLKIKGNSGDTIMIRYAEMLNKDGKTLFLKNMRHAECTDYYICDGKEHNWTSDFVYHGFRYVEVTGMSCMSSADIIRELISDKMDDEDTEISFTENTATGKSVLNNIVANARRGIKSNYKGMPLDCPQRDERMPWLGDRTTGCLGESYLMDIHALYNKWTADICQSQRKDGNLSDVAPTYWRLYTGNITWPAALPFACDMLYRQYGDIQPMYECYPTIRKWLSFMRKNYYDKGIITRDKYGDWCVPPESLDMVLSKDSTRQTDGRLISSAYYVHLCQMMQQYAGKFGYKDDADYYKNEAESTADSINRVFLHDGMYANGTVTANLLPLAMYITPANEVRKVTDNLIKTIVEKNGTHISSGVIGIQWLMRKLEEAGQGNIAYQLATNDTYPSWGYMVKNDATTIWELWNGNTANPSMNSGNHVMLLGDLLPWCYESLGGISSDHKSTGFKRIIMKPDFSINKLSGVKASHPSPYGIIRSEWKRNKDRINWKVTIPANTSAELHLPNGKNKIIGSGEYIFNL